MSTTIDERVVEMRFDNRQFESNVSTTMSTLDKLKQKLNLSGASKGLEDVGTAAKGINLSSLGSAAETVGLKFNAMYTVADQALRNITNSAVNAGKRIASALTIDPIKTGFKEYETQTNAVQTILANTSSKGTTLQQVNSALDTLNKYADMTIYNFTEMTRNIGTSTAAGIDLETSVSAIQGIANLAALSGSTSQQASTAMYQLSQALASGTVKLMDWNSVVNAGMGGQVFQDALKQTAKAHGIAVDEMIEKYGSFRESLSEGWITSEILTETLNQFTMAAEEGTEEWEAYKKSLMDNGYTKEQAVSILKMANTATDAATKVKTFTQLWDTLKESAQSGWTESWEIMIGDFEEAKSFLTDVSDRLGSMIGESAEARNAVLSEGLSSGWKQLLNAGIADEAGFKDTFKSVAKERGTSIDEMISNEKKLDSSLTDTEAFQKALKTGFKDGSISADMLTESVHKMADKMSNMSTEELIAAGYTQDHVKQIKELSAGLKDGSISMDDFVSKMTRSSGRENIIQALWNAFDGLMSVLEPVKEAFREVFPPITGGQLYKFTEQIRDLTAKFKLSDEQAVKLKSAFKGLFSILDIGLTAIKALVKGAGELISKFKGVAGGLLSGSASIGDFLSKIRDSVKETNFFGKAVDAVVGFISKAIDKIKEFGQSLTKGFKSSDSSGIFGFFKSLWGIVTKVGSVIVKTLSGVSSTISEILGKGDIFEVLNSGLIAGILVGINKFTSSLHDAFDDVGGFVENVKGILDDVRGCLQAYQDQLKANTLVKIAGAIGILAASLWVLSTIDADSLGTAIIAITVLFGELVGSMALLNKSGDKSKLFDTTFVKMVAMSVSILILAAALRSLSGLSWGQMVVGLTAVSVLLWELVAVSVVMSKTGSKMIKGSVGLIALAVAIKILASVCKDFSTMGWEDLGKGAAAIGALLLELSVFEVIAGKAKHVVSTGLSMILIAASLKIIASALSDFAKMNWLEIGKGLSAMGGALAELAIAMNLMPKGSVLKATGLVIAAASLKIIASALSDFAKMNWLEIGKGLSAMGGALAELAIGLNLMKGTLSGAAALLVAAVALAVMVPIMKALGDMSWEQIAKGLITLAGAFIIIGVAGLLLQSLTTPILLLAAAFVALGIGMVGIGAGLALISAGIAALGTALAAGATAVVAGLTVIVTGILELIPTIARIIGKGIVEIAKVLGENIPQLVESLMQLLVGTIRAVADNTGELSDALLDLLINVINSLANHMPALIEALVNLIVKVFEGLGNALKSLNIGDLQDGIAAASGIAALMLAMSVALKIAGSMKIGSALKGILALTAMAIPLLAFAGVLGLIHGLDDATDNALALAALAGACSLMLLPLTLVGTFITQALLGVAALTAMAVPMLAFVGVLAVMSEVENATTNAMLLMGLMTVMTNLLVKISLVAPLAVIGVAAMSGLTLLIGAIGTMAVAVGALMETFPSIRSFLDTGLPILEQLAGSIGTMIGKFVGNIGEALGDSLVKIGEDIAEFMDKLAEASDNASGINGESFDGVKQLMLVMAEIGGTSILTGVTDLFSTFLSGESSMDKFVSDAKTFFSGMKEAMSELDGAEFNEEGLEYVLKFATRLADLQGKLDGLQGFMTWLTGLNDLSLFGTNSALFLGAMKEGMSELDEVTFNQESLDYIVDYSERLANLQGSLDGLQGFMTWLTGLNDLSLFGTNSALFLGAMKEGMSELDEVTFNQESLDYIVDFANRLSDLESNLDNMDDVVSWFGGRTDLGTFGTNIGLFTDAMTALKTGMGEDGMSEEVITSVINAGNAIIALQEAFPEEHWFDGKIDLSEFSDYVTDFATAMATFGEKAAEIDSGAVGLCITTAHRIKNLIASLADLDTSGLGAFTGIGIGAGHGGAGADGAAYDIACAIAEFSNKVKDINIEAVTVAVSSAQKIKSLIASLVGLDTSGIENFKPGEIGDQMKTYGDKVGGIGPTVVSSSITSANRLKNFISSLAGLDTSGIGNFRIGSIGTSLKNYAASVSGFNAGAVSSSISAANRLKNFIAGLSSLDTSGVSSFKTAINQLSTVNISALVKAFSGTSSKLSTIGADMFGGLIKGIQSKLPAVKTATTSVISSVISKIRDAIPKFESAGKAMATRMAGGLSVNKKVLSAALVSCLSKATTTIRNYYNSFYNAGSYLVTGFANGISANTWRSTAKAKAMAEAAETAARNALKINSPSKVFKAIGSGIPEGFAMGIGMLGGEVKQSVTDMTSDAITASRSTMTTILDALSADMDTQPTIRPVIDLTDVKNGASSISSMLNATQSVGVQANLNAINVAMNRKLQNGTNDDIISAINKLNDGLDGNRGDTYNFAGITYDNGNEISDAVQTLVRAAKMGRRV